MLVKKNYSDQRESVYKCDRCKANLKYNAKASVYIGLPRRSAKIKWHLCKRCYMALCRGIEKGMKRDS